MVTEVCVKMTTVSGVYKHDNCERMMKKKKKKFETAFQH